LGTLKVCSAAAKEKLMTIEEMKSELKILDQQVKELAEKRTTLRQKIADAQALFAVGARVTYEGAGCVWEITAVRPGYDFSKEPEYIGAKIKKDGNPGAVKSRIYVPYKRQLLAA